MNWFRRWWQGRQIDTSPDSVRTVRVQMLSRVRKLLQHDAHLPLETVRALRHVETALAKEQFSEPEVDVETVRELSQHG